MQNGGRTGGSAALMLAVIAFVSLMDGLDASIVNVALPAMAKEFGTDTGTIAWVAVIYFVMLAGLIVAFARVAKNGPIKGVLLAGLALFTAGSLFCGVSASLEMLLAFRAVQGVGAAMMAAAVPMACVRHLPPSDLGLGMGVITLGCSVGFALGPAAGGLITDLISWHWIFLINVPLGLAIVPLALKAIPADEAQGDRRRIDVAGAALLFSAVMCGIAAVERAPYPDGSIWVITAAVVCATSLAAFVAVELRRADPLLDLRVFRHWRFDSVLVAYTVSNLVYMGMLYLLPFYMGVCMGLSPSETGMYILISPLLTLLLCVPIARWSDRTGRRAFAVVSCLVLMAGCLTMAFLAPGSMALPLVATLVCMGLMWALAGGPMASRIIENTEGESREMGSSIMSEFIYLGGALGTALFAMLFTLGSGSGGISFSDLPPDLFLDGFVFASVAGAALAAATAVLSLAVRDQRT
ncbi:MAG: MFS transporter [Methanomassiliicoccaceae archaeon]|nr:MFS transporter [Methanomassiliicoccaceae archaeon]